MAASSNSDPKKPTDQEDDSADVEPVAESDGEDALEGDNRDPLLLTPDEDAETPVDAAEGDDRIDGTKDAIADEVESADTVEGAEWDQGAELDPEADIERSESDESLSEDAPTEQLDPEPEPRSEPVRSEPAQAGSGGFLPLLLGGVAAAGIGFAVAQYGVPEGWPTPATPDPAIGEALTAQADRIAALETALADLPSPAPTPEIDEVAIADAVEARLGDVLRSERAEALDTLSVRVESIAAEVAALAERPVVEGAAELSEDQIAALQANLDAAVADARAEMEAALQAAAAAEAEADRAAQTASARAALDRVRAAADAGTPYTDALNPIRAAGAAIPDALARAADTGLPTLPVLQESFPDAARAALDASIRAQGSEAPMDRALTFLRTQTGARSLTPREGNDPDAVLSRAEAALRSGDLTAVLAELDALPEAGQAEMTAWRAEVEARAAALAALSDLSQALDET